MIDTRASNKYVESRLKRELNNHSRQNQNKNRTRTIQNICSLVELFRKEFMI